MTCRSHPRVYPAENGHPSHDHSPSLHWLLSESSEHLIPGELTCGAQLGITPGAFLSQSDVDESRVDAVEQRAAVEAERQHNSVLDLRRRQRRLSKNDVGGLFGDHDRRGVGVAGGDERHHGGVRYT
jgi:hypothetical protein